MSWKQDLSKSSAAFLAFVWPEIREVCGGGELKPVETLQDNELARDLDVMCGIDAWQTVDGHGCRGIASRVQQGNRNWGTFTIRAKRFSGTRTEYDKRKEAIHSDGRFIYPYLTCQAYVSHDWSKLLGGGVARTVDVFAAIDSDLRGDNHTTNAAFYWVHFCEMQEAGYKVHLFGTVPPAPARRKKPQHPAMAS